MASFCGGYPGSPAEGKDKKLIRAVNSFLNQSYTGESELIIVADGCTKTQEVYEQNWKNNPKVKLFFSQKLPMYSGGIRTIGMKMATGDIITYIDNDDVWGKEHLKTIMDEFDFDNNDFVYYDDLLCLNAEFNKFQVRYVETRYASIGTSSITHKNFYKYPLSAEIEWPTGYGHDFLFVMKMVASGARFKKLSKRPQYIVCHYGGGANF